MNIFSLHARPTWLLAVGSLLILGAVSCSRSSRPSSQTSERSAADKPADPAIEVSSADAASDSDDPCSEMFSNLYVDVDSISYNKYEIVRLHKTVYDKPSKMEIPVSYAVLRSPERTIATFEGIYFGAGNETEFGFASLLGGETKQLIVSQIIPRNGRHWVVDLAAEGAVIFDSQEWDLGQEDVCVHDFDGDGVSELSLVIGSFCGIGTMSIADCPIINVDFKYDSRAGKYLPDRSAFAHLLEGIEEDAKEIDPAEETTDGRLGPYLATRLDIFLRYAYAGREDVGWAFFDRSYNGPDKKEMREKISAALRREPVFKFVYGKEPRFRN